MHAACTYLCLDDKNLVYHLLHHCVLILLQSTASSQTKGMKLGAKTTSESKKIETYYSVS